MDGGVQGIPVRVSARSGLERFRFNGPYLKRQKPTQRSRQRNLINIPVSKRSSSNGRGRQLPSFLLSNVRSLFSKVDELTATVDVFSTDVAVLTESWLHDGYDDHLINIPGFNLFRRDRLHGRGGGVCAYVSQAVPCKCRIDLENALYECMWLWLRPHRLPRPLSGIITRAEGAES